MDERERFDALLAVLDDLVDANATVPILVEGQRDVEALRRLGCRGEVLPIHNGRGIFLVCEEVGRSSQRAILLTDWDRKGSQLLDQLSAGLVANGVVADSSYRDRIRSWARTHLKDVESLLPYVTRGLDRFHRQSLEERDRGFAAG